MKFEKAYEVKPHVGTVTVNIAVAWPDGMAFDRMVWPAIDTMLQQFVGDLGAKFSKEASEVREGPKQSVETSHVEDSSQIVARKAESVVFNVEPMHYRASEKLTELGCRWDGKEWVKS